MSKKIYDNENISRREMLRLASVGAMALTASPFISCSSPQHRPPVEIDKEKPLAITNCRIVDVNKGAIMKEDSVVIENSRISRIITSDKADTHYNTIDAGGRYLIPGLIDAHCHPTMTPVFEFRIFDALKHYRQQQRHFSICIETGVTTIRDVGAFPISLRKFINSIESGNLTGPRVFYANSMMNIKGGHPDINQSDITRLAKPASLFMGHITTEFESTEELEEALRDNTEGAHLIKLTMDDHSVFYKKEKIPVYDDEHLRKIFNFAEKKELPVSAHCQRIFGLKRSLKYPMNSVEHIPSDGLLKDEDIELMLKRNTSVVPTMMVGQSYMMVEAFGEIPAEFRNDFTENELAIRNSYLQNEAFKHCDPHFHRVNLEYLHYYKKYGLENLIENKKYLVDPNLFFGMMKYGTENLKKMHEAGVHIGCGIDAGMPFCYFGGLQREMEFYSRAGFKNHEILKCATINNAQIIRADDITGSIETGKLADMVLLESNPLKDISACSEIALVVRDGQPLHASENFMHKLSKHRLEKTA